MSIYRAIVRMLEAVTIFFWRMFVLIHELTNIWAKRALVRSSRLTSAQSREAKAYWNEILGHGAPLWRHYFYASDTDRFDARRVPEILFPVRLKPSAFNFTVGRASSGEAMFGDTTLAVVCRYCRRKRA